VISKTGIQLCTFYVLRFRAASCGCCGGGVASRARAASSALAAGAECSFTAR
jgi:hypothetical protein